MHARRLLLIASALALAALLVAVSATATIAPRNCGPISAKGKRYTVKSHIVGCSKAKPWMDNYLETGRRPPVSGWRCRTYSGAGSIKARCVKADRDFFAIKR